MSDYSSIISHRTMVFDEVRNSAYGKAIEKYIHADSVVLDLGSGLGILGLMALAKGAKRVYFVDPSPVTAVAEKVAAANLCADRAIFVQEKIESAQLPEKVDAILSVFTGNFLLEEDLLPKLFFARDQHLKAGGYLIPGAAEMRVAPVFAEDFFDRHIASWSVPSQSIDFSLIRKFAANATQYHGRNGMEVEFLADAKTIKRLDFYAASEASCHDQTSFIIKSEGACHGFLGWFRMQLGNDWLSTSPMKQSTHWSQVFLPVDPPLILKQGDILKLRLIRPQHGEWSWTYEHQGNRQTRSVFLSHAIDVRRLRSKKWHYKPALSLKGEITNFVVARMDGAHTVELLTQMVIDEFEGRGISPDELRDITQSIILQNDL